MDKWGNTSRSGPAKPQCLLSKSSYLLLFFKAAVPGAVCKGQEHHSWGSLWLCQALAPNGEKGSSKQHLPCLGPSELSFHFLPVQKQCKGHQAGMSDSSGAALRPEGGQLFRGAGVEGDHIGRGGLKFTAHLENWWGHKVTWCLALRLPHIPPGGPALRKAYTTNPVPSWSLPPFPIPC